MSNHYSQYLIDKDAEDHEPGLRHHARDPFMARHFADYVGDFMDEASLVDVSDRVPNVVYVEYTDDLTREAERVMVRVANECGYHLKRVDAEKREFAFTLNDK